MIDPDDSTVVALLRCLIAGDRAGAAALVSSTDPAVLLGATCGFVTQLGVEAFGSVEAFDEQLAGWQARRAGGVS